MYKMLLSVVSQVKACVLFSDYIQRLCFTGIQKYGFYMGEHEFHLLVKRLTVFSPNKKELILVFETYEIRLVRRHKNATY